ncbi:hypothetical protein QLX08_009921 [Tetragonisca angustula]|uniref:Uncharacterized protein n=1 Tax=Tetragonisca angustula TaxID=166442 RepID=A0AAW0ZEK7_9HYME
MVLAASMRSGKFLDGGAQVTLFGNVNSRSLEDRGPITPTDRRTSAVSAGKNADCRCPVIRKRRLFCHLTHYALPV